MGSMGYFFDLVKWAWKDAKDKSHSCLNDYSYEKGHKQWNLLITKDEWLEKQSFETLSKVYGCGLKKILVDLYIPSTNPRLDTSQLDIVFINRSGIYVIEVKNYTCKKIKGTDKGNWKRIEFNGRINDADNPIKQNTNHIKNLMELFPYYPKEYFKNIIVYSDAVKIEYEPSGELPFDTTVINFKYLKSLIKVITKESEEVFSDENIYRVYNELSQYARCDYETRRKHVEQVNALQN